jgi:predicted phage terminase large subunit-like protein
MTRNPEADQYEFFEFPAILNENTANEKALWPEFFDLKALHRTKASMPAFQWNAQYQQSPTAEEASLVKREWWRLWDKDEPPDCEYIIMALDAAAEANNRADFTALTTWGVFTDDNLTQGASHIILLNAINVRVEFPELKDLALREYKEWEPDAFIVEKKSSGTPLFQELRRMGVPVSEFTPHRGTGDKIARLNAVADIFRSGMVWYPAGRRWAEEVIEQVASFPASENDDLVDTVSMSLARYRAGGFIRLASDEKDEPAIFRSQRQAAYY